MSYPPTNSAKMVYRSGPATNMSEASQSSAINRSVTQRSQQQQQQPPIATNVPDYRSTTLDSPVSEFPLSPGTCIAGSAYDRQVCLTSSYPSVTFSHSHPTTTVPSEYANSFAFPEYRRPLHPTIAFRDWYISNYCNDQNVSFIAWFQNIGGGEAYMPSLGTKLLTFYFKMWSITGEAEFYTAFIPFTIWIGLPVEGMSVCATLCMSQYLTGTVKDTVSCPRPPCPPLELRGNRKTHTHEYGFPSTHSSHGLVFAYYLFNLTRHFFPGNGWLCFLGAVAFAVNVALSRVYLAMHWVGDLVGGATCAFFVILFDAAFLRSWIEVIIVYTKHPNVFHFLALLGIMHLLIIAHAAPPNACPCYVDSIRFLGALVGGLCGLWAFRLMTGDVTARPPPPTSAALWSRTFSLAFLFEYIVCMVLLVIAKELSSIIAGFVLKRVFIFLSGAYFGKLPSPIRKPYIILCRGFGAFMFQPRSRPMISNEDAIPPASPVLLGYFSSTQRMREYEENRERHRNGAPVEMISVAPPQRATPAHGQSERNSRTHRNSGMQFESPRLQSPFPHAVNADGDGLGSRAPGDLSQDHTMVYDPAAQTTRENTNMTGVVNGDDSFLPAPAAPYSSVYANCENQMQQWTLVTHSHWWLWDTHKRLVSYLVVGLMAGWLCPLVQRYFFKEGAHTPSSFTSPPPQ